MSVESVSLPPKKSGKENGHHMSLKNYQGLTSREIALPKGWSGFDL